MKIYLHIGTENTGTTSIQNFLSINRNKLIEKGIYYPEFDNTNHISLPIFASRNYENIEDLLIYKNIDINRLTNFKKEFKNVFLNEINNLSKKINTIILSDEHCSSRLQTEIELLNLRELLYKISKEIKIIVYLRRQDEFLLTHYNVCIKYGNKLSFEDFIQNRKRYYESGIFNHLNLVYNWSSIFGKENLIIKIFDKDELFNKSIINDFMRIFNIDDITELKKTQDLNISLNPKAREFLRYLNTNIEIYTDYKPNPVRENVNKIIEKIQINDIDFLENPKRIEEYYKLFEESNKQLAKEFLNRENLFINKTKIYNANEPETLYELDLKTAFEIFSKILKEISNEIYRKDELISKKNNEFIQLNEKLIQKEKQVNQIITSNSWKITKPLLFSFKILKETSMILILKKTFWHLNKFIYNILPFSFSYKENLKKKFFKSFKGVFFAVKGIEIESFTKDNYINNNTLDLNNINKEIVFTPYKNNSPIDKIPVKFLVFYLPQFHAIPENDDWWGEGFTEWTNVKPAKPLFEGHYQPHIPVPELGYYNLLNTKTQEFQVKLAKNYGISGFCFHFYWFNGKTLLEKPIENYLKNKQLDLPFCLSWANENWTRRWDGMDNEILIKQHHSSDDDFAFIKHVSKYMKDERYIRINGKPLLMVYRTSQLPSAKETAARWRQWCLNNGIGEIYLATVQSFEKTNPFEIGYDAAVEFPPNPFKLYNITKIIKQFHQEFKGDIYDWKNVQNFSYNYDFPEYKLFRGICPSWDNTARRKNESRIFYNNHPDDFKEWIYNAGIDTIKRFDNTDERLIFINAWNEWAEGAHLEPDEKYGYTYLQNIYDTLKDFSITNNKNTIDQKHEE